MLTDTETRNLKPREKAYIRCLREVARAIELSNEIWQWLRDKCGIELAVSAVSGNGAHLLIRIPDSDFDRANPGESEVVGLVKGTLAAIVEAFSPEKSGIKVDQFLILLGFGGFTVRPLVRATIYRAAAPKELHCDPD